MKVTLEFNLPNDNKEYELARLGERSHLALWEMWNLLHRRTNGKDGFDGVDQVSRHWLLTLLELLDEHGVPLEI